MHVCMVLCMCVGTCVVVHMNSKDWCQESFFITLYLIHRSRISPSNPQFAFMANLDRQCALKSPATTPEALQDNLHTLTEFTWGSRYPNSHPPFLQQALNHKALSQTHIDLIFNNSFHTFLFYFLTVSLLLKESLCYLIIFDSYDFLILLQIN